MSAGRKAKPEKSLAPRQPGKIPDQAAVAVDKDASSHPESLTKSGKPEHKAGFAQGTYYRQGVLVPGGPHKGPLPRSRSREMGQPIICGRIEANPPGCNFFQCLSR